MCWLILLHNRFLLKQSLQRQFDWHIVAVSMFTSLILTQIKFNRFNIKKLDLSNVFLLASDLKIPSLHCFKLSLLLNSPNAWSTTSAETSNANSFFFNNATTCFWPISWTVWNSFIMLWIVVAGNKKFACNNCIYYIWYTISLLSKTFCCLQLQIEKNNTVKKLTGIHDINLLLISSSSAMHTGSEFTDAAEAETVESLCLRERCEVKDDLVRKSLLQLSYGHKTCVPLPSCRCNSWTMKPFAVVSILWQENTLHDNCADSGLYFCLLMENIKWIRLTCNFKAK